MKYSKYSRHNPMCYLVTPFSASRLLNWAQWVSPRGQLTHMEGLVDEPFKGSVYSGGQSTINSKSQHLLHMSNYTTRTE